MHLDNFSFSFEKFLKLSEPQRQKAGKYYQTVDNGTKGGSKLNGNYKSGIRVWIY